MLYSTCVVSAFILSAKSGVTVESCLRREQYDFPNEHGILTYGSATFYLWCLTVQCPADKSKLSLSLSCVRHLIK